MAEGGGLLNRYTGLTRIGGSNPLSSAIRLRVGYGVIGLEAASSAPDLKRRLYNLTGSEMIFVQRHFLMMEAS